MAAQILHQIAGQLLDVHDVILDGAGKRKTLTDLHVIKLRPQDAGGIQQLQRAVHRNPLLAAGHTGAVLRLGGLSVGHLVDEGGLAHVGNTQHHHPDGAAYLTLFGIGGQLVAEQLPHGSGKLRRTHAAFGIGLQHRIALSPEIGGPALCLPGIGLIHPVEHHQTGLSRRHLIHIRIPAGQRDPGVQNLAHRVHIFDLGHDHALGFRHMAGKPAQAFYLHGQSPHSSAFCVSISHFSRNEKQKAPTTVDAFL